MSTTGHEETGHAPDPPVVVLISADWAGPSRPAPTVLRELARRWGTAIRTLWIEDPAEEVLDLLEVEVLPTWLRFSPGPEETDGGSPAVLALQGRDAGGAEVTLPGPWRVERRRTGALPKHVIDTEFGPAARTGPRGVEKPDG